MEQPSRIAVIDDDENFRAIVEVSLGIENFQLDLYPDGDSAMSAFRESRPDLALVDIQMPGTNGIELCKWIKGNFPQEFTPVILLTSQSEIEDKVRGFTCGADDYVTKPCSLAELTARVRAFLRIKSLTDELRATQLKLAAREKELLVMQVAGAAAHELGQPLTTLLLDCQMLSRSPETADQSLVVDILDQAKRMREILNRLNSVSSYKVRDYVGNVKILDLTSDPARKETD